MTRADAGSSPAVEHDDFLEALDRHRTMFGSTRACSAGRTVQGARDAGLDIIHRHLGDLAHIHAINRRSKVALSIAKPSQSLLK